MVADACSEIAAPAGSSTTDRKRLLNDEDEEKVRTLFLESALLPIIEAALRSGSILEMAKEFDLYKVYLKLIETLAKKAALLSLMNDIGPDYQPR